MFIKLRSDENLHQQGFDSFAALNGIFQDLKKGISEKNTDSLLSFIVQGKDDHRREIRKKLMHDIRFKSTRAEIIKALAEKNPISIFILTRQMPSYDEPFFNFTLRAIPQNVAVVTFINHVINPEIYGNNYNNAAYILMHTDPDTAKACLQNLYNIKNIPRFQIQQAFLNILNNTDLLEDKQKIAEQLKTVDQTIEGAAWDHIVSTLENGSPQAFAYLLEHYLDLAVAIYAMKSEYPTFTTALINKAHANGYNALLEESAIRAAKLLPAFSADILEKVDTGYPALLDKIVKKFSLEIAINVLILSYVSGYLDPEEDQGVLFDFFQANNIETLEANTDDKIIVIDIPNGIFQIRNKAEMQAVRI